MSIKMAVDTAGQCSPVKVGKREQPFRFARLAALGVCIATVSPFQSAAQSSLHEKTYPGAKMGSVEARWIAPYVFATRYEVLGIFETMVRWYDGKGKVTQELSGPSVMAADEYISEGFGEETVIHGLSGLWKLALPKKPTVLGGFFRARGEAFIRELHPTMEETAIDVYESGKLVGSVGPFIYNQLGRPEMSDDGSVSFTIWKTAEKKVVQVVVIGPDAKIRIQVDCGEDVHQPYPIANEEGVILRMGGPKQAIVRFKYVAPGADPVVYDVGPNASPLACASPSDIVLFRTNVGEVERFQLVHGKTGESIWDIESPVRPYPNVATSALVADDKVFVLGRDVAAIDLKSGRILIRWETTDSRLAPARFFRRGNDVFIVTDKEFHRLNVSNLEANHIRSIGPRF